MSKELVPGHPKPSLEPDGNLDMGDVEIDSIKTINMSSAGASLVISSGAITTVRGHHRVDTEGGAATDDLDTINGGDNNDLLLLFAADGSHTVRLRHAIGNIFLRHQNETRSETFISPTGSSGLFYASGFYNWSTTDANLNETSPTSVTHGSANNPYAAHASIVAGGAGSVNTGVVKLTASGTTIDDEGNRATSQTVDVVDDITTLALNTYVETPEKFIGQVVFAFATVSGSPTVFNLDFNYGFSKYEDLGNQAFSVTLFECVGRAGANDTGFNIRLFYHNSANWHYATTGFVPGPTTGEATELANMRTTHGTESDLTNGEEFSFKLVNLNTDIAGDGSEGFIVEITTTANKAIESMDMHLGVHTVPNFLYLAAATQHVLFMRHGGDWHQI